MAQLTAAHQLRTQTGFIRRVLLTGIACLIIFGIIGGFQLITAHAAAAGPAIKSAIAGYCLDDYHSATAIGAVVDLWACNNTTAQAWAAAEGIIKHDNRDCLTVQNNGKRPGDKIVMSTCSAAPGQVWLRDRGGYFNPNSGLCLAAPGPKAGVQLEIDSCQNLDLPREIWTAANATPSGDWCTARAAEGQRIACLAQQQWTTWQSGSPDHETLLSTYTDGTPYEQWCADFVSYVYKQAGYPFTGGEADGWDESNANNIQNQGFTLHQASSGYTPKAGDVAYFDYNGGHVEIVVSGGPTPTFVYGDSATIDPTTGNGQMMANTITGDASGQLIYYLSPN